MNGWWHRLIERVPGSLRIRLALPLIVASTVVFLCLYLFLAASTERSQLDQLRDDLRTNADVSALALSTMVSDPSFNTADSNALEQFARRSQTRMTIIAADGTVLADTEADEETLANHNDRPEVIAARDDGAGSDHRKSATLQADTLYVAVSVPESDGIILRLAVPTTEVDESVASVLRAVLFALLMSLIVILAACWFFAGRLAKPLESLGRQAMRMAVGDFSVRVPPSDVRELNNVGRAFNRMASRLEELIERQAQTSLRLESVMEGLIDGVVLTDDNGLVLRMNPAAENMLGLDEEEALGKPFVQASRDYEIARVLNRAMDGKEQAANTVDHGVDHRAIHVMARAINGDQQRLGLVVLRDVTDVRRLETVRREFVANVSHELRTPLTSIRALVETLEAGAIEEPEIAMDFLARIVGEIDRLNTLLEDLLDFARLEAGRTPLRLEYITIGEVLENGARRLQQQIERAELTLVMDVADDLPEVAMDVARIEQVLINLIHNAIKFTPAGGTLTLRSWREKNTVHVGLRDTGVGIPEEEQARLFERFYKSDKARRSEGTGLGLAIAQNIVRLHGGRISVSSAPGEGSEFVFTLPLKRKKAARRARKHSLKGLV